MLYMMLQGAACGLLIQPAAIVSRAPPEATLLMSESRVAGADVSRRAMLQGAGGALALSSAMPEMASAAAPAPTWSQVDLPLATESPILFDIEFDPANPSNGFLVGNKGTFLQTFDAGKSWQAKSFANLDPEEEINYRFTKMSFLDGEGWIIGKPAILLHTRDSGKSWERVPLSPKLPGDPYNIIALGAGKAEMATSAGAIYTTENAGRNWKAEVRETIDATLNRVSSSGVQGASFFAGSVNSIERYSEGAYLAISSRGNFYLTFTPGDEYWIPHNRQTSRRITAMGFVRDKIGEGLWMSTAGGELSKSAAQLDAQVINIPFDKLQIKSGGYGILDVAFLQNSNKAWAVGGGGTIFGSTDSGATWQKDKSADDLPTNLYKIKFFGDTGYILGSNGVLLRSC